MSARRSVPLVLLNLLIGAVLPSCATTPEVQPTLMLEQHSLRIPLTLEADGTVLLAERPPLIGRIDLSPILRVEGVQAGTPAKGTVQLMMHYGRLYVVADAFHAIWEITPQPGTTAATFRPIPLSPGSGQEPMKNVRLSRYGSSQASCLRLDRADRPPVFITAKGDLRNDCP